MAPSLQELSFPEVIRLYEKEKSPKVKGEIQRRKNLGARPKVRGFKKHKKLSELQKKILRLFLSAVIGETTIQNTAHVEVNFAKHSTRGGWISWLTSASDDLGDTITKISRLRATVEEEKKRSGLCRIYLIPVRNEKDGWEGFKVRLDRGTRLVYEDD